jgi:hypothetical protein
LHALAAELQHSHPGATASLREGIAETLTVTRLGIRGALKRTLESTNPCESMIECVRRTSRNVKRWQSGDMALRWTAAGMLEAEQQFRRVIGYRELAKLASPSSATSPQRHTFRRPRKPLRSSPPDHHTGTVVAKFHDERDILRRPCRQEVRRDRPCRARDRRQAGRRAAPANLRTSCRVQ